MENKKASKGNWILTHSVMSWWWVASILFTFYYGISTIAAAPKYLNAQTIDEHQCQMNAIILMDVSILMNDFLFVLVFIVMNISKSQNHEEKQIPNKI